MACRGLSGRFQGDEDGGIEDEIHLGAKPFFSRVNFRLFASVTKHYLSKTLAIDTYLPKVDTILRSRSGQMYISFGVKQGEELRSCSLR